MNLRKNWWKLLGVLMVGYTVISGLSKPLKTGVIGIDKLQIQSAQATEIQIDIYNPAPDFKPELVLLKNENNQFLATDITYNQGIIKAVVNPAYGKTNPESGMFHLFVKANGHWMSLPSALAILKSSGDTLQGSVPQIDDRQIQSDPDKLPGFPNRIILYESIRNLFYHVPMWFSMIFLLSVAAFYSIKYLNKGKIEDDMRADALIKAALLAGILGCVTGSVWASVTWNSWWPRDPKLNGVAIGMMMYFAYLLLRTGIKDDYQKARVAAVYNLFVFPVFIALIAIMPKLSGESLHPGAGGTVTFKQYDLDNTLRMYFYPAVIGWICLFAWIANLTFRYKKLEYQQHEEL